jgi:predicted glycosyltransferase
MTTEAAVLGTPAVRSNSFVGINDMGNFIELEQKYNLIFNYSDQKSALLKAIELLKISDVKEKWIKKRDTLLQDKIDVTSFLVWFTENYPESFEEMKRHPEIQYRFR